MVGLLTVLAGIVVSTTAPTSIQEIAGIILFVGGMLMIGMGAMIDGLIGLKRKLDDIEKKLQS